MARLENLTRGTQVNGIPPDRPVNVVGAKWYGSTCVELTHKDAAGRFGSELLCCDREPRLAYLFDPLLAVYSLRVEPLPHQIAAVYADMLPRLPLRFLLADDPGAGKTIRTGITRIVNKHCRTLGFQNAAFEEEWSFCITKTQG